MTTKLDNIKRAELLSTAGAAILGGGLALLFADWIRTFAIPLMSAGLLAHATGMFSKHRLETRGEAAIPAWHTALYWTCWVVLLGVTGAMVARIAAKV